MDNPARYIKAAKAAVAPALHCVAIVCGWALLTAGVAALTVPEAWLISGGLFLLSLAGWGQLRIIAAMGVYALSRSPEP